MTTALTRPARLIPGFNRTISTKDPPMIDPNTVVLSDSASPDVIFQGILEVALEFATEMREVKINAERLTRRAAELGRKAETAHEITVLYAELKGIPTDDRAFDDVA